MYHLVNHLVHHLVHHLVMHLVTYLVKAPESVEKGAIRFILLYKLDKKEGWCITLIALSWIRRLCHPSRRSIQDTLTKTPTTLTQIKGVYYHYRPRRKPLQNTPSLTTAVFPMDDYWCVPRRLLSYHRTNSLLSPYFSPDKGAISPVRGNGQQYNILHRWGPGRPGLQWGGKPLDGGQEHTL